jgi:hypothetical protein
MQHLPSCPLAPACSSPRSRPRLDVSVSDRLFGLGSWWGTITQSSSTADPLLSPRRQRIGEQPWLAVIRVALMLLRPAAVRVLRLPRHVASGRSHQMADVSASDRGYATHTAGTRRPCLAAAESAGSTGLADQRMRAAAGVEALHHPVDHRPSGDHQRRPRSGGGSGSQAGYSSPMARRTRKCLRSRSWSTVAKAAWRGCA